MMNVHNINIIHIVLIVNEMRIRNFLQAFHCSPIEKECEEYQQDNRYENNKYNWNDYLVNRMVILNMSRYTNYLDECWTYCCYRTV